MSPAQYCQWLDDYDRAGICAGMTYMGQAAWEKCYCSDAARAVKTACRLFTGDIIMRRELRELQIYPVCQKDLRLPLNLWVVLGRIAWLLDHPSQLEQRRDFNKRLQAFVNELLAQKEQALLVVSHGGFMYFLRRELIRRGFHGPWFFIPPNGKLYIYEKN